MFYLLIMFLVAAVGITSLWVQQRRERAHLDTVEGFRSSLQKIAPESHPEAWRRSRHTASRRTAPGARPAPRRRSRDEAARREAARRRVEARRRARASVATR